MTVTDEAALGINPMVDGRRFTEAELARIVREINPENAYGKTDYDPGMFLHRTAEAIARSYGPCHNPRCLKREVGTNLGTLLKGMRGYQRGVAPGVDASSTGQSQGHALERTPNTTAISASVNRFDRFWV